MLYKILDNLKPIAGVFTILGGLGLAWIAFSKGISDINNVIYLVFAASFMYSGYFTVITLTKDDDNRPDILSDKDLKK